MLTPRQEAVGRGSFARTAALTYGTNVAASVLSLGNVVIVGRTLGAEGRGGVALLTAIAAITAAVASLGVQQATVNLAASDSTLRRALAGNAVVLSLGLGAVAIGFLAGLIAVLPGVGGDSAPLARWIALASVPATTLLGYLQSLLQADYRFGLTNLSWLAAPVTNLVVNATLAATGHLSILSAVSAWVGGQVLGLVLVLWGVRRGAGFGRPDLRLLRRSLRFGVQSHAGTVLNLGNYRLDQWLVGTLGSSRELGLYSIAVAWSEALFFLPTTLAAVQRPDLVRASRREAGESAAAVFRICAVLTLPLAVGMVLLAPVLCTVVFGEDFRGSIDDLRVLVPAAFGILAMKLCANAVTAQGRPLLATAAIGAAFAMTVGLDVALIPPLGGLGAAFASLGAYTVGGVTAAVLMARALGIPLGAFRPGGADVRLAASRLRALAPRRA